MPDWPGAAEGLDGLNTRSIDASGRGSSNPALDLYRIRGRPIPAREANRIANSRYSTDRAFLRTGSSSAATLHEGCGRNHVGGSSRVAHATSSLGLRGVDVGVMSDDVQCVNSSGEFEATTLRECNPRAGISRGVRRPERRSRRLARRAWRRWDGCEIAEAIALVLRTMGRAERESDLNPNKTTRADRWTLSPTAYSTAEDSVHLRGSTILVENVSQFAARQSDTDRTSRSSWSRWLRNPGGWPGAAFRRLRSRASD